MFIWHGVEFLMCVAVIIYVYIVAKDRFSPGNKKSSKEKGENTWKSVGSFFANAAGAAKSFGKAIKNPDEDDDESDEGDQKAEKKSKEKSDAKPKPKK